MHLPIYEVWSSRSVQIKECTHNAGAKKQLPTGQDSNCQSPTKTLPNPLYGICAPVK